MRIVVSPAGSRGDFQPMLALAVGLRAAGHDVLMVVSPNFEPEAQAFGIPMAPVGLDVEAYMRSSRVEASPLRAAYELFRMGRSEVVRLIDESLPLMKGADVIIGAGAQIAAPTVCELTGIPYVYFAYAPHTLRSEHHPAFTMPFQGLPRLVNRALWSTFVGTLRAAFGGPLDAKRAALGLGPVKDWYDHFFPISRMILAADPELAPLPPDLRLPRPPTGALHLPDHRPLDPALERFLDEGPPPVYIGFGSMPDRRPERTTKLIIDAARAAGTRLVLSSGWARYGAGVAADDVHVVGSASHNLLFPRVAAVVHHGGAGTTGAALRAGRPQVVVPHAFDQFGWARCVVEAGIGPQSLARSDLSTSALTHRLQAVIGEHRYARRAGEIAAVVQARDPIDAAIRAVEAILSQTFGVLNH